MGMLDVEQSRTVKKKKKLHALYMIEHRVWIPKVLLFLKKTF